MTEVEIISQIESGEMVLSDITDDMIRCCAQERAEKRHTYPGIEEFLVKLQFAATFFNSRIPRPDIADDAQEFTVTTYNSIDEFVKYAEETKASFGLTPMEDGE